MAQYADPAGLHINQGSPVRAVSIFTLLAGIVAILFCGYAFWQVGHIKAQTEELQTAITQHENDIDQLKPVSDSLARYDTVATNLHALYDNQRRWPQALATVEARLYKNMKVTSLQVSDTGTFTLSGIAPNYTEYAKVFASLTSVESQKTIASLQVVSVGKGEKKDSSDVLFTFQGSLTNQALTAGSLVATQ
jgi:Tfp pilus assembly protein PilN